MKNNMINYYGLPIIKVDDVTVKELNSSFVYTNKSRYIPVTEFLTNKIPSIHILDCILDEYKLLIKVENISIKDIKSVSNIFSTTNLTIVSGERYSITESMYIVIEL